MTALAILILFLIVLFFYKRIGTLEMRVMHLEGRFRGAEAVIQKLQAVLAKKSGEERQEVSDATQEVERAVPAVKEKPQAVRPTPAAVTTVSETSALTPKGPVRERPKVPEAVKGEATESGKTVPVLGQRVITRPAAASSTPKRSSAIQTSSVPKAPKAKRKWTWRDWEVLLGGSWLNRLGVTVLVIGISLFVGYTFEHVGNVGKFMIAYTSAVTLFGLGTWLERKKRFNVFSKALLGGAWAAGYFTTYGIHFFESARIVHSEILGMVLLGIYVTAMLAYSLRFRSQIVTFLSVLIAYITVALGGIQLFSLIALLLLTAFVVVLSLRFRWFALAALSVLGSFSCHIIWFSSVSEARLLGLIPMSLYWFAFVSVAFLSGQRSWKEEKFVQVINTLSALGVTGSLVACFSDKTQLFISLQCLGAAYTVLAIISTRFKEMSRDRLTFGLLAITSFVFSIPLYFSGDVLLFVWLFQVEVVLVLGVLLEDRIVKSAAISGLGLVALLILVSQVEAVLLFAGAVVLYANQLILERVSGKYLSGTESRVIQALSYPAGLMAVLGITELTSLAYTSLWMLLLSAALFTTGFLLRLFSLRVQAYCVLLGSAVNITAVVLIKSGLAPQIVGALTVLGCYALSSMKLGRIGRAVEELIVAGFGFVGSLVLSVLLWRIISPPWIPVGLALIGIGGFELVRVLPQARLQLQGLILGAVGFVWFMVTELKPGIASEVLIVRLAVDFLMIASFYYLASRLRSKRKKGDLKDFEAPLAEIFSTFAAVIFIAFTVREISQLWIPIVFATAGTLSYEIALRTHTLQLRKQTYLFCMLGFAWYFANALSLGTSGGLQVERILIGVVLTAAFYYLAVRMKSGQQSSRLLQELESTMPSLLLHAGGLTCFGLIVQEVNQLWVPAALTLAGVLAYESSLRLEEGQLRLQNHCFALLGLVWYLVNVVTLGTSNGSTLERVIVGLVLTASFYFVFSRMRDDRKRGVLSGIEATLVEVFSYSAGLVFGVLTFQEVPRLWVPVFWSSAGILSLFAFYRIQEIHFVRKAYILISGSGFFLLIYNLTISPRSPERIAAILVWVGLVWTAYWLVQHFRQRPVPVSEAEVDFDWIFLPVSAGMSCLVLAWLTAQEVGSGVLTVSWAAEAMGLFFFGLMFRGRELRLAGVALLLICVLKLFILDLSNLETQFRILSFIGLGLILILVSFLYVRLGESLRKYL